MSSAVSVRSSSRRGPIGRFLLTTALVTLGLSAFGATDLRAQQVVTLNNGDPDPNNPNALTQKSGEWRSGDKIWSVANNANPPAAIKPTQIARLPVLVPNPDGTVRTVQLDLSDEIALRGMQIEGNGYSLQGTNGATLKAHKNNTLNFNVSTGAVFEVTNVGLSGEVNMTGNGEFRYSGQSGSGLTSLSVGKNAIFTLVSTPSNVGQLSGTLTNSGTANLAGRVGKRVTNSGTMNVTGPFLAEAGIENQADGQLTIETDGNVSFGNGERIDNIGTTTVFGTVDGEIRNRQQGSLEMRGGSVGSITNRNRVDGFGTVEGDLGNLDNGRLVVQGATPGTNGLLTVKGGLTNVETGRVVINSGSRLDVGRGLSNTGELTVGGGLTLLNTSSAPSGTQVLTNIEKGRIIVQGSGFVQTRDGITNNGSIVSSGNIRSNITNGGALETNAGSVVGVINNAGAKASWKASNVAVTGSVRNAASVEFTNTTMTGTIDNSKDLTLTDSTVSGLVTNTGNIDLNGTNSIGSLDNSGNGTLKVEAGDTLQITDGALTNSSTRRGNVAIAGHVVGNVTNTGSMDIGRTGAGNAALIDGTLTNGRSGSQDGELRLTGTTQVNGNMFNYGKLTSSGSGANKDVTLNVRDRFTNHGTIEAQDKSTLTINANEIANYGEWYGKNIKFYGKMLNGGTANLNEDQTLAYELSNLAGGIVNVSADINANNLPIDNAGDFNILGNGNFNSANPFTNSGSLDISNRGRLGAVLLSNTGTVNNNGTIVAPIANQANGILNSDGRIEGNVTNLRNGTANLSGVVAGLLTNGGTVNTTGDLFATTIRNNNVLNVRSGHSLNSNNAVENRGTMNVAGNVNPNLTNVGRTNLTGGRLNGDVENTGTISGNGRIAGQLENRHGSTLEVTGGTLAADKLVRNAGIVRLDHTLVGNIGNFGLGSVVMTGKRENGRLVSGVDGNISNQGSVSGTGAITGVLTNNGTATATIGGSVASVINRGTSTLTSVGNLDAGSVTNGQTSFVNVGSGSTLRTESGLKNNGTLTIAGTLGGQVNNAQGATTEFATQGARRIDGTLSNAGTVRGDGAVTGNVNNTATGIMRMTGTVGGDINNRGNVAVTGGRLNVGGTVQNDHQVTVRNGVLAGDVHNRAELDLNGGVKNGGGILGNVTNDATVNSNSTIQGDLDNTRKSATANLRGVVTGTITNRGHVETTGNLQIGGLDNRDFTRVNRGHILSTTGSIRNTAKLVVNGVIRRVTTSETQNAARAPGDFELINESTLRGSGTINMNIRNEGRLLTTGILGGYVNNTKDGIARISGVVRGAFSNAGELTTTGDLRVGALETVEGGRTNVAAGDRLTSRTTASNSGRTTVAGVLDGSMLNRAKGTFNLEGGHLTGSIRNEGTVNAHGRIGGVVENRSSDFNLTGNLAVGGFFNDANMKIDAGKRLTVAADGVYANNATTDLAGRLVGEVQNAGTFKIASTGVVAGAMTNDGQINVRNGRITGTLTNNGTVEMHDLAGGRSTSDVLHVGGLAGDGEYNMSLNLATMTGDRIEVEGGSVTGSHQFNFKNVRDMSNVDVGSTIKILDVDQAFNNNYTFSQTGLSGSERIVYRLIRTGSGDLEVTSGVNPAIGSMLGNIMLSHSLIGTVINRPTSPYVVGMAYEDKEKPCGVGSWARAMGGHATANGAVSGPGGQVNSEIKADYYGMQVGTDLACFDGHFDGWDMAVGGLFGVNRGSTTQPIPNITTDSPDAGIASVTKSDFDQIYGGLYLTATKDRWTLDVQYRYEKTNFDLENTPIEGIGLGLLDNKFSSTANTLAGAVSYAMPIADSGWTVVPQAGFAWSKYKIDDMRFTEGYRMKFGDAERKVGFVGATLTKTFVQPSQNSAFNLYGTATYYNDFAKDTVSTFVKDSGEFAPQRLTADNLGSYTEISIGSNYIKVLPRVAGRPRQFSAGARLDGRFGDNIDSVGVTGQFRFQF